MSEEIQQLARHAGIPLDDADVPGVAEALQEYAEYIRTIASLELTMDAQPATVLDPGRWSAPTAPEPTPAAGTH
jgi:hypothetical protein